MGHVRPFREDDCPATLPQAQVAQCLLQLLEFRHLPILNLLSQHVWPVTAAPRNDEQPLDTLEVRGEQHLLAGDPRDLSEDVVINGHHGLVHRKHRGGAEPLGQIQRYVLLAAAQERGGQPRAKCL